MQAPVIMSAQTVDTNYEIQQKINRNSTYIVREKINSDSHNLDSIDKIRQNRTSEKHPKYNNVNKNVVVPFHQDLINFNNMK